MKTFGEVFWLRIWLLIRDAPPNYPPVVTNALASTDDDDDYPSLLLRL